MSLKNILKTVFTLIICVIFTSILSVQPVWAATVTNLVDFNNTSDLTNLFNPSSGHTFTNIGASGISNSGAINVPNGSYDIWTTKQGYSVSGVGDVYTFSAFFKIKANSGYGGLGFSRTDTNQSDMYGSPVKGIGMAFHGGGGYFVNNRTNTAVSWPPDLTLGNWYKMVFVVTAKGSNTYDLKFQIWNSDANGNLGTMKTEKTLNGIVNTDLGGASTIHGYFSAAEQRMEKIDNFLMSLEGGASFVESGFPVVLTSSASNITNITDNSATIGGNVTDGQGSAVTAKGNCWSTHSSPTTGDSCTNDGSGLGAYTSELTGLTAGTAYYVRAYATNSSGTSYGSESTFNTLNLVGLDIVLPTPTPTTVPSSNNNSSSLSSPPDLSCHNFPPVLIPDLFQINTTGKTAKLFFTPIDTNQFYISFSTKPNAEEHGEQVTLLREGVQSETVYYLKPNTTYYVKVRGQNGCMAGKWSNIMKITTNNKIYYKNSLTPKNPTIKTISKKTVVNLIDSTPVVQATPTSVPEVTSPPQPSVTPVVKKSCFLWWCR